MMFIAFLPSVSNRGTMRDSNVYRSQRQTSTRTPAAKLLSLFRSPALILWVLFTFSVVHGQTTTIAPKEVLKVITAQGIRAQMSFLADDLVEGRGTGTRGYNLAAKYVAAQLEAASLKPAGVNNTFFQDIPLRRTSLIRERSSVSIDLKGEEQKLGMSIDYELAPTVLYSDSKITAPLAFVGYGVTAPEFQYDDYAGMDVAGRVVVMLFGAPAQFGSAPSAYYSSFRVKAEIASSHGAVGILTIWTGKIAEHYPFKAVGTDVSSPSMNWLDVQGHPNDAQEKIRASALLSVPGANKIFEGSPKSLEQALADANAGRAQAFLLPAIVTIQTSCHHTDLQSPNVVAVLPGSDPKLKREYVLFSAHLDHLGIGDAVNGDNIYNGALDNASGTAALIEIAKAFASSEPPRRSIIFLAVTGEEEGLLGSDYFAHFPTVAFKNISTNINIDEVPMLYDFRDIVPFGAEHSSLGTVINQVAAQFGVEVSPDPAPEEVYFIRSDQFSFVKQGIPSVDIDAGYKTVDPNLDGKKITDNWEQTRYHQPSDDMNQPLNFDAATRYTRIVLCVGYAVAQADNPPHWNAEDFFLRFVH